MTKMTIETLNQLRKKHAEEELAVTPGELTTQEAITLTCINFKNFLLEKNLRYGDSALSPVQIFSKESVEHQIENRLDDKLSRIKNRTGELKKNDVADSLGYHILLMVKKGWLTFDELLD